MAILDAGQTFGTPNQNPIDEIFVLSDGEPVSGDVIDPDVILKIVREINRYQKVRIHTVFVGTSKGVGLMKRLAQENGGYFVRM